MRAGISICDAYTNSAGCTIFWPVYGSGGNRLAYLRPVTTRIFEDAMVPAIRYTLFVQDVRTQSIRAGAGNTIFEIGNLLSAGFDHCSKCR